MEHYKSFADLVERKNLDVANMSREELDEAYKVASRSINSVYRFVFSNLDFISKRHVYAPDAELTMLEIHLLTDICDMTDPTVTQLATAWNRSMSATSQTVQKLIEKNFVVRENSASDRKVFFLRPTQRGREVAEIHKRYDVENIARAMREQLKQFTIDEIELIFRYMECYSGLPL